ncbi:hypothetical protein CTAYLR_005066 [Chrysophaeum taylorii]|uniref:Uncharacterized protein n=1 Tax=Chrysophaeum taylorii TaxID=2483200 RepID=A0AAD7UBZ8_9STRA|nr:hypothetical protein CTAYLR_005066 [Chrysophaeum taylorii]
MIGKAVRIDTPPPGDSNAKFRGRVGVVTYSIDDETFVVAVERRDSERDPKMGLSAENCFEFLPVEVDNLKEVDESPAVPEWIAPLRKRKKPEPPGLALEGRMCVRHSKASRVAVIVPFRDLHKEQERAAHLAAFVPHMTSLLGRVVDDYRIVIVEQEDDGRKFNRGKLLNIGYRVASDVGCDAFVFHDVDLLPGEDIAPWYAARPAVPIHLARVWDRYTRNADYVGGIASWNALDFECINGFPNNYWGWGGEDDEMMRRCKTVWGPNFAMDAPLDGTITDLENMDLDQKLDFLKSRPEWKCQVRWELRDEHADTWHSNGLRTPSNHPFAFSVLETTPLGDRAAKYAVRCDLNGDAYDDMAPLNPPSK